MKHIQVFEQFKDMSAEKPQGFFSKMMQGAKHSLGFENEKDRKDLDSLHRTIDASNKYNLISGVREIKPGVLVAYIDNGNVTVDVNTPEIMYKGRKLDLHNMEQEAEYLYNRLNRLKQA